MIISGTLQTIGSGVIHHNYGCTGFNSISFDSTEVFAGANKQIFVPNYLADKVSLGLGKSVQISISENKRLITAIKIDGKVYKLDGIQNWVRQVFRGSFLNLKLLLGSFSIVFPPLLLLYIPLRISETKELNALINALD
jgi:hypothetical protein